MPCHMGSYTEYRRVYTFFKFLYRVYIGIYFHQKYMTSYDGIGISLYMMVHDRHMSLYDKNSVLILVMATDVPGIRTLVTCTCLLILPNSVPGCFRDWYMLAHPALLFSRLLSVGPLQCGTFVARERHARSSTNDFILSIGFCPFSPLPLFRAIGGLRVLGCRGSGCCSRGRCFSGCCGSRGRGGQHSYRTSLTAYAIPSFSNMVTCASTKMSV